jgi:hypothetical protein
MPILHQNSVWLVDPTTNFLISPYTRHQTLQPIPAAKPFTVSLLSCVVAEDLDGFLRGNNDILILTQSSLGEKPPVDRVLCYEQEIPEGQPLVNLLSENILVTDDYSGIDRLWLELRVMEIDTDEREYRILKNALTSFTQTLGAAFPVLLPYTFIGEAVAGIKVTCPELGGNCLLVGDNEQKDALFLYPVSSKRLDSNRQSQLALEKKISDIEAIAKLDDNKVLLLGSHSRNSQCEVKENRQRFLQAKLSGNQLKIIGELVQSPQNTFLWQYLAEFRF